MGEHHHHHHHHHHHDEDEPHAPAGPGQALRVGLRFVVAGLILAGAVLAACAVVVGAGQAMVITRFGDPVRVLRKPGLAWKMPTPIDAAIPVDLRLRTTSTGMQDVGTRDGLRVLVQAYVAWQVADDPAAVRQFLRAARNDPDEAARQLRSLEGAALQITASSFSFAELVNTDPAKLRLDDFEARLAAQLARQTLPIYGIAVRQVGIERLSLPAETLAATVERMRAERETVAAQRTAAGLRAASEIRSDAQRDSRITVAQAQEAAAQIEAQSRAQAAAIFGQAYARDPQLYTLLRSLDTIGGVVGANTRIILRTDAAPFRALIDGPPP
jgi:membrane protease subunit HflC